MLNTDVRRPLAAGTAAPRPKGGHRRTLVLVLVGAVLVTVAAAAWRGAAGQRSDGRLLGPNLPVNASASDPGDISANNSPSVARNPLRPTNLVVANRVDRPAFSCSLHASFDGGSTWADTAVPFPDGEEQPPRCYAPDVAYTPDGTLVMAYTTLKGLGNTPNALWVVSSADGGRTLSAPVRAAGPLAFQARLTADRAEAGRLHLTWLQASEVGRLSLQATGNPIQLSTSDDRGATWSEPVRVSSERRARVVGPSVAVGARGQLFVLFLDVGDDRLDYEGAHDGRGGPPYGGTWSLVLARSTDEGRTWRETLVDDAVLPAQRFVVFIPPTPDLVVDGASGRVYVAFADAREGDADVWLWASGNGGRTFASPVRVNDNRPGDRTDQYLPKVAVAPDGRVDVVYFDRRRDPAGVRNEVSLQSSGDHGKTFSRRLTVSDTDFDSRVGPGSEYGLADLGSRLALVSSERRALAVWTDTRGGTDLTGKQDLARAVIRVGQHTPPSGPTRLLAGVLAAVGLAALFAAFRLRPRSAAEEPAAQPATENGPPAAGDHGRLDEGDRAGP